MFDWQNNNLERALEWIFSHPDPEEESDPALDTMDMENNANANILAETGSEGPRIKDGPGSKFCFSLDLAAILLCHTHPVHRAPLCFESSYCGFFWTGSRQFTCSLVSGADTALWATEFSGLCLLRKLCLDSLNSKSPKFFATRAHKSLLGLLFVLLL